MSVLDWLYAWSRRHPIVVDALTGLPFTLLSLMAFTLEPLDRTQLVFLILMLIGLQVALTLRSQFTVAALWILAVVCVTHILVLDSYTLLAACATFWAAYLAHARGDARVRKIVTIALLIGTAWASLDYSWDMVALVWWQRWPVVLVTWFAVGFFCLLGTVARKRQEEVVQALSLAETLRQQQAQEIRLATLGERTHIARELHDIVAHSLGVIIAQADGGRYAADTDPAAAKQALTQIAEVSRGSLSEMRSLLSVLRTDDARDVTPAPTTDDLDELVLDYRKAGLDVRFTSSGSVPALPPTVALTIYRIVQESLTNVLKHAGTTAHVRLDWLPDSVIVEVRNDLGTDPQPSDGHGLVGMRERVTLLGGTLSAGPTDNQWVVHAVLPFQPSQQEQP